MEKMKKIHHHHHRRRRHNMPNQKLYWEIRVGHILSPTITRPVLGLIIINQQDYEKMMFKRSRERPCQKPAREL